MSLSAKKETNPQPELISLHDEQDQVQLQVAAETILYLQSAANYVEVTGNAQGYKLHFAEAVDPLPVSRSCSQDTLAALEA